MPAPLEAPSHFVARVGDADTEHCLALSLSRVTSVTCEAVAPLGHIAADEGKMLLPLSTQPEHLTA